MEELEQLAGSRVPTDEDIKRVRELGRIGIGLPELQIAMEQAPSLRFLALDLLQLNEFAAHSGVRDPFDRLILSACRVVKAKLVTRDRFLRDSGVVHTVWG